MPQPIMPIGNTDLSLFDRNQHALDEQRDAKSVFKPSKESKEVTALLQEIDKYQDGLHTAAAVSVSGDSESKVYKVPPSISNESLLMLKGKGYVSGSGRTVAFTKKGKDSIKKAYLSSENQFKQQRAKKPE